MGGGVLPGDPAVDGGPGDVGAEVAHHIAGGVQAGYGGLPVDVDFQPAPDEVRLVLHELHGVLRGIDALFIHVVEQPGEPTLAMPSRMKAMSSGPVPVQSM